MNLDEIFQTLSDPRWQWIDPIRVGVEYLGHVPIYGTYRTASNPTERYFARSFPAELTPELQRRISALWPDKPEASK